MIIRFHKDLCNTIFKARFEGEDKDGKVVMYKLAKGEQEVIEEKQKNKNAVEKEFRTGFANTSVNGELFYQTEITDQPTIEFLKNYCDENRVKYWGGKITEYDPQAESKAKLAAAKEQAKLIVEATNLKGVELLQVGIALFGYSALKHKQNDTMDELQLEVIQYASQEPENFEEVLKDKEGQSVKSFVYLAFAKELVVATESGNSVSWGDTKEVIIKVARGKTPTEDFAEFLKTNEGREIKTILYERMQDVTKEAAVEEAKATKSTSAKK
jgi:hypothetical protein